MNGLCRVQKKGYGIIGSRAIESAHRTIIQKTFEAVRSAMGLKGYPKCIELRVTKGSGQWNKVIRNIKLAVQNAALTKLAA